MDKHSGSAAVSAQTCIYWMEGKSFLAHFIAEREVTRWETDVRVDVPLSIPQFGRVGF